MKIVKIRGIISSLLIVIFIIIVFTSIGLYFAPSERIARETGWIFLGFNRFQLENIHTIFGFLMFGIVVIHLILNYKMFLAEIKALFK